MRKRFFRLALWIGGPVLLASITLGAAWFTGRLRPPASRTAGNGKNGKLEMLPEEDRAYLWACEHKGQIISQIGFKKLGMALVKANASGLRKLLGKDFEGSTLQQPQEIRLPGTYIHAVRAEPTPGIAPKKLSADAFVEEMLKYRKEFGKEPQVKIALMALSPQTRGDLDSAYWEGSAVLRIFGESPAKGPSKSPST